MYNIDEAADRQHHINNNTKQKKGKKSKEKKRREKGMKEAYVIWATRVNIYIIMMI